MKAYLKMLVAAVAMFATVACDEGLPPQDGPEPQPTVEVEVVNITDSSLEFGVTTTNAAEVRYIFAESSEAAPSVDNILAEGVEVEENTNNNNVVALKFEELAPSTKYTLHVAVKNTHGTAYAFQEAQTEEAEVVGATINIEVGEVGETAATFTITTTNATTVKYCVYDMSGGNPDELISAEEVLETGTAVEANATVEVEVTDLTFGKEYEIVVAAEGESGVVVESETFKTATPAPELAAALTEDIGYNYAVFSLSAEYVAEVKYVCIVAGSRDVTAEQVLKNGTPVESGEVKVEGLKEETSYEIYVAAKGLDESVLMADALTFTTTKNIVVYNLTDELTASSYSYSSTNFFLTFIDEKQGYTLNLDFYAAEDLGYLPSGEYALAGLNGGEVSSTYSRFFFNRTDTVGATFNSGSVNVVASPNQETREVYYEIDGTFYFEDGNSVVLSYEGLISGIELPEVVEGAPEGAHIFEVKESIQPTRYTGNSVPGEYYIKFTDNDGDEFRFDLLLDPATCDNGNAVLPTGTYTTEQFNLSYTDFVTYRPSYKVWNITEIEVDVVTEGETHTIVVNATMKNGGETKPFYMNWSGEINVQ
ncbi:MAG: hypothetical protein IKY20_00485 [Alistipes sp.]|nr:hypothetical protein [Alistipes sp.]